MPQQAGMTELEHAPMTYGPSVYHEEAIHIAEQLCNQRRETFRMCNFVS